MKSVVNIAALCAGVALAGCATVESRPAGSGDQAGIAYFLPRQLARVVVVRKLTTLDLALKDYVAALADLDGAKAAVAEANAAVVAAEDAIIANSNDAGAKILDDRFTARKNERDEATAALAGQKLIIAGARQSVASALSAQAPAGEEINTVTVAIDLLDPTGDPAFAFRLSPNHKAFRDDHHKLGVSSAGLLESANIVSTDRTADILVELATFAGAMVGVPGKGPPSLNEQVANAPCQLRPATVIGVVDFANQADVGDFNAKLACMGTRLKAEAPTAAGRWTIAKQAAPASGLYYRTPSDIRVEIEKCPVAFDRCIANQDANWAFAQAVMLSLPQAGPVSYVRQDAGLMTRSSYDLAFEDGILTGYESDRPSELLEVARTPMRVVNGAFDGISKIVSLRIGRNTSRDQLAASRTDSAIATLNNRTRLSNSQTGATIDALRNQAKLEAINACVAEKRAAGEAIDSCIPD